MIENQVCVADNPKTHTTKFKWLKDLPLSETDKNTLGDIINSLIEDNKKLKEENKTLKMAIAKNTAIISKLNLK